MQDTLTFFAAFILPVVLPMFILVLLALVED